MRNESLTESWNFCPGCASPSGMRQQGKRLRCAACGLIFFHNPAAAVAAIIRCHDEVLFAVRSLNPAAGKLDFPGGFADPGESLEAALERELQEELGLRCDGCRYLFSVPNVYPYRGVIYNTVDGYFEICCTARPQCTAGDDVAALVWRRLETVRDDELAFPAMRLAIGKLRMMDGFF